MLKFTCLALVLFMAFPLPLRAEEYNPAAPSAAGKATNDAAQKSMLPESTNEAPAKPDKPIKKLPVSDKEKFDYFDTNKNGTLSYKEFVRYSGRTKLQDIGLQKRFQRLDKNFDRKLSFDEVQNPNKNP